MMVNDSNNSTAGKLYGKSIKLDKFSIALQETRTQTMAQVILLFGVQDLDQLSALRNRLSNFLSQQNLNQLTWERLLLLHLVKQEKIEVDRDEVVSWISSFPLFQQQGKFDGQRYESVLRNAFNTSSIVFEKQLKKSLQVKRLQETIVNKITSTDKEIKQAYTLKNERATIEFIVIDGNDLKNDLEFNETEAKAYYETNKEAFRVPNQIKTEYFVLKQKDLAQQVEISEEEIATYYNTYKEQFKDEKTQLEKPLTEVRESITAILKDRKANDLFYEKNN